jgi:glycosyltransferase involved in cell wall biosynthesis
MKKKIIHFIFNLGRGGAETMLVRVIKELPEYQHVVVTLFPMNHFENELQCDTFICLNLSSLFSLPFSILKFRRVVKKEKPDLVHTHLFWPTIIARIAVPKKIPLLTTIHAFIATSIEYTNWHIRFLDKLTYRLRKNIIIGVAKGATEEYFSFLQLKPYRAYTLYTFVDIERFNVSASQSKGKSPVFRVISVGALRMQKNYLWVIKAFEKLKDQNIELHIYGTGNLQQELQDRIDETGVKILLQGEVKQIENIIPQYDLYLMASTYEGFSLSVLEAMAMGIPLLLSDIASFKEQCDNTAAYFSLEKEGQLAEKILEYSKKSDAELQTMAEKSRDRAIQFFTLPKHIEGIHKIYSDTLTNLQN